MSEQKQRVIAGGVRSFLRSSRDLGYAEPGGPLHGLPATVTWGRHDSPAPQRRDNEEIGSALPGAVLVQLTDDAALALLSEDGRRRFQVGLEVGRRPSELCGLVFDCLDWEESSDPDTGATLHHPVLLHDMPKVRRTGARLPISRAAADLIEEQQKATRRRYPDADQATLKLWPAAHKNPAGALAFTASAWARELRLWATKVAPVEGYVTPDGAVAPRLTPDGRAGAIPVEAISPYSLRHTYAQRHIDAGTPVTVLKELMGHASINTTHGYYRISTARRREAVNKLGPVQFTVAGTRAPTGGVAAALRYEVGQVAVPFGTCVEPSNVAAHGQSCPFRHKCFGCSHFRTDPSYLAELKAYLGELLLSRERLNTAVPGLAEWARAEARPGDDEISVVRGLIGSCERVLADLDGDEAAQLLEAIQVLRDARQQMDATFPPHLKHLAAQPQPVLFPTIERRAGLDATTT